MQKILTILVMLFCLESGIGRAQAQAFEPTGARKAVRTSTDVAAVALPVAALAGVLGLRDWEGLKEGALTAAATAGATYILKYAVKERRPDWSDRHSFPSGHTSVSFAAAGFVCRRYGWKVGGPALALAAYTGWGRIYGKKHHWWDVLAGAGIGAASACIFTRKWAKEHQLSVMPLCDGYTQGVAIQCVL